MSDARSTRLIPAPAAVPGGSSGAAAGYGSLSEKLEGWGARQGQRGMILAQHERSALLAQLSNDIRDEMNAAADQYREDPQAYSKIIGYGPVRAPDGSTTYGATGSGKYAGWIAKAPGAVQADVRAFVSTRFASDYQTIGERAKRKLEDQNRAAFIGDIDGLVRDALGAAKVGHEDAVAAIMRTPTGEPGPFFERLYDAVDSGAITMAQAQAKIEEMDATLAAERLRYRFSRNASSSWVAAFERSDPRTHGLMPDEQRALTAEFRGELARRQAEADRITRQAEAAERARIKALKHDAELWRRQLDAGYIPTSEAETADLDSLLAQSAGSDFGQRLYESVLDLDLTSQLAERPAAAVDQVVRDLRTQAPGSYEATRRANKAEAFAKRHEAELLGSDPTGYVQSLGTLPQPAPADFSSPPAIATTMESRKQWLDRAEATYAQNFPMFTAGETRLLRDGLGRMDPGQQATMLGLLGHSLGTDRALAVMGELDKQQAPMLAMAGSLAVEGRPDLAEEVLVGRAAMSAKTVKMPTDVDWRPEAESYLGDVLADDPVMRGTLMDAAMALYAARSAEAGDVQGIYEPKRMRQALEDATGGVVDWTVGGDDYIPFNQTTYQVIPPLRGWSASDFADWIDSLTADDLKAGGLAPSDLPEGPRAPEGKGSAETGFSEADYEAALDLLKARGRLQTLRPGIYHVWVNERPWIRVDGEPFELRYGN